MSTTSTLGAPVKRLRVNNAAPDITVLRYTMSKSEGAHDVVSLFVDSSTKSFDFTGLPGQRIEFDYGNLGAAATFQGYIQSVVPNNRLVGNNTVLEQEIVCLGPTMIMKGNSPRFWTDMTATQVIADLCQLNQLGLSDEFRNDEDPWRSLAQTCETDWEMIVRLANLIGARVVPQRGVIRLINYNDVAARQLPTKAYVRRASVPSPDADPGAVLEFVPSSSSVRDPTYTPPSFGYLSGRTAAVVGRSGALYGRFSTAYPAQSAQEAVMLAQGYYDPSWKQTADLTITGDSDLEVAQMVQVNSTGHQGTVISPEYDGIWYVNGVDHSGAPQQFFSTLHLGRPLGRANNWYQERPFWLGDKRGVPRLFPLGDGTWVSTWR